MYQPRIHNKGGRFLLPQHNKVISSPPFGRPLTSLVKNITGRCFVFFFFTGDMTRFRFVLLFVRTCSCTCCRKERKTTIKNHTNDSFQNDDKQFNVRGDRTLWTPAKLSNNQLGHVGRQVQKCWSGSVIMKLSSWRSSYNKDSVWDITKHVCDK